MTEHNYWEGHRDRMRQRAEKEGFEELKENQLIELLLCYAVPRVDLSDVAKALADRFGTAVKMLDADREALLSVPGVTGIMADWLLMTAELLHAYQRADPMAPPHISCYWDVSRLIAPLWPHVPAPQTWMLYVDFECRLLMQSVICESLGWANALCARQIVEEALSVQAKSAVMVLFVGTEPLEMEPWELDYLVALSRTLRAIGVELLDCVLVGDAGMVSLNYDKKMEKVAEESGHMELHENYRREVGDEGIAPAGM